MQIRKFGLVTLVALMSTTAPVWADATLDLNPALTPVEGSPVLDGEPVAKDKFRLGLSNFAVNNTWRVQMIEEAKYEATLHDKIGEMIVTDAGGDVNKQTSDIEDLIARGIDALLVSPGSEVALNGVLDKAYSAGIPVIIFSSDAGPTNYSVKIMGDDKAFGKSGAEYLVEALGGKGNIIAVRGIAGNSIDSARWAGADAVFAAHPEMKVIDQGFGDWAYDKGKQVCESLLIAHPDVTGIWSSGGAMTKACAEVLNENGLPQVPMTGEGNNGFIRIWQEMDLKSVAPQYPTWFGQQSVIAALRILQGEPVAKDYVLAPGVITRDKIADFYRPELNDSYWVGSSLPAETLKTMYSK